MTDVVSTLLRGESSRLTPPPPRPPLRRDATSGDAPPCVRGELRDSYPYPRRGDSPRSVSLPPPATDGTTGGTPVAGPSPSAGSGPSAHDTALLPLLPTDPADPPNAGGCHKLVAAAWSTSRADIAAPRARLWPAAAAPPRAAAVTRKIEARRNSGTLVMSRVWPRLSEP